jgi:hypothetical protein
VRPLNPFAVAAARCTVSSGRLFRRARFSADDPYRHDENEGAEQGGEEIFERNFQFSEAEVDLEQLEDHPSNDGTEQPDPEVLQAPEALALAREDRADHGTGETADNHPNDELSYGDIHLNSRFLLIGIEIKRDYSVSGLSKAIKWHRLLRASQPGGQLQAPNFTLRPDACFHPRASKHEEEFMAE